MVATLAALAGAALVLFALWVSRQAKAALIAPYPVGRTVRVHDDPHDLSSAVLDPAQRADWWYWLLFGGGFLLLAGGLASR